MNMMKPDIRWNLSEQVKPPEGVMVRTLSECGIESDGKFVGRLYFPGGGEAYDYSYPRYWRPMAETPQGPQRELRVSKLYQIHEDDLAELERILPQFQDRLMTQMDNCLRMQIRKVQTILMNVRWNYGPPTEVHVIPVDEPPKE